MHQVSEHFTLFEARCRCGCGIEKRYVPEITAQAQAIEALRAGLNGDPGLRHHLDGSPSAEFRLFGLSWVRCPAHNLAEGGVPDSRHLPIHCDATDLTSPELPAKILYEKAKLYFPTVILYRGRNFIHVDRRTWADNKVHAWIKKPSQTVLPQEAA